MREPSSPKPEKGPKGALSEAEMLRKRLDALKSEIGTAQQEETDGASPARTRDNNSAIGKGMRAGSELLAGVLVGGGIGYFLDAQTGLSPLFLIVFVMLGMGAGFWNVYRLSVPSARNR